MTPTARESDHAQSTNGSGPSWVGAVVNAIGESKYWNDTAIFVTWDDWGGWYDHVPPPLYNSYELGFRVPLIVISPYAKAHYVTHVPYVQASIMRFIEDLWGLAPMATRDSVTLVEPQRLMRYDIALRDRVLSTIWAQNTESGGL